MKFLIYCSINISLIFYYNFAECDSNQTIFAPEGSTTTFNFNITERSFYDSFSLLKRSGSGTRTIFHLIVSKEDVSFGDSTWENRTQINITFYSDYLFYVRIDLSNVSMMDNGTYQIRGYPDLNCFVIFIMGKYFKWEIVVYESTMLT